MKKIVTFYSHRCVFILIANESFCWHPQKYSFYLQGFEYFSSVVSRYTQKLYIFLQGHLTFLKDKLLTFYKNLSKRLIFFNKLLGDKLLQLCSNIRFEARTLDKDLYTRFTLKNKILNLSILYDDSLDKDSQSFYDTLKYYPALKPEKKTAEGRQITRKVLPKKPLQFREIQWGIYNTSSLQCNGFLSKQE